MAKQQNNSNSDPAEAVIFFARVRGGGEVVAESLRALGAAIDRATSPKSQPKPIPSLPAAGKPVEKTLFDPVDDDTTGSNTDEFVEAEPAAPSSPRAQRGEGPSIDRNAGITLVGDIDFVPADKESLKAFFASKSPTTDMDNCLVISYYLQHTLGLSAFGFGHVLSGLKHVGKRVPKDLRQTLSNMKSQKAWIKIDAEKNIQLTTEGDNRVEHDLPKAGDTKES
ncbi:MAG: hypothetical protein QM770_18595 [Tepidisphaeraceae bacterium]